MPKLPTPSLHPSEDYEFLRREGLAHLQRLSGRLWTDFNVHDPGVTMLEILAFAVADLGFRAGHPIADILAPDSEESAELKQFFTLAEIATSRPWTPTDYRKLLIDMDGVANAWLSRSRDQEVFIYLQEDPQRFVTRTEPENLGKKIQVNGLYEVAVRFEQDPEFGDLNDNSVRFWKELSYSTTTGAQRIMAEVEVEFPCYRKIPAHLMDLTTDEVPTLNTSVEIGPLGDEAPGNWYCNVLVWKDGNEPTQEERFLHELRLEWRVLQTTQGPDFQPRLLEDAIRSFDWRELIQNTFIPRRNHVRNKLEDIRLGLLGHRNLCEDIYTVVPMDLQEIALDMDLEVRPGTHIAALEAAIYLAVQQHLDPPIRFHSLGEMLDKGRSTEEIFDGPLLKNGFLDPQDWPQTRTHVYASDLIHIIMDQPDVVLVRAFTMRNRITGDTVGGSSRDALILTEPGRFQPVVDARRSNVRFWNGRLPVEKADDHKRTVMRAYEGGLLARIRYRGIDTAQDLAVPTGRNRNLDSYYSVREEFPIAWGIGSAGLPMTASAERIKQAEQLKGFLLHFEQMLCLYLAQLRHVKHLLSVGAAPSLPTYMHRVAQEVMGLDSLLLNPGEFPDRLAAIVETEDSRIERRERLLDHLLSRFQTSLSEAAALSWREGGVASKEVWIYAKSAFLQAFPSLSAHRAGAIDYSQHSANCSPIPGFQRRVMGLMGWTLPDAFRLKWIEPNERFQVLVVDDDEAILMESNFVPVSEFTPMEVMDSIVAAAGNGDLEIVPNTYRVRLVGDALVPAESPPQPSEEAANSLKGAIHSRLAVLRRARNFVTVEHILLRPRSADLLSAEILRERLGMPESFNVEDPWSFRVSFVFPNDGSLIDGVSHAGYRRLLQQTIREELPAHVIAEFFWLDSTQWSEFNAAYDRWRVDMFRRARRSASLPPPEGEAQGEINGQEEGGKYLSLEPTTNSTNVRSLEYRMNQLKNRFGAVCIPPAVNGLRSTDIKPGAVLVDVIDPDGDIVKAWPFLRDDDEHWLYNYEHGLGPHALPAGLVLDQSTGKIQAGPLGITGNLSGYTARFFTMNQAGGVTYHEVQISLVGDARPRFVAEPSPYDFEIRQGNLLGRVVDDDSTLVEVTWNLQGVTQPPPCLALNPETGELRVGDKEEWDDMIEPLTSNPVRIPVAFLAKNDRGVVLRVPATGADYLEIKRSHAAIATPHREMANGRPASYYATGDQYLYVISDNPDGGIRQVTGRSRTPDLSVWGLTTEFLPTSPKTVGIKIIDLGKFLTAFGNSSQVVLPSGAVQVILYVSTWDMIGGYTSLNLELIMGAETRVQTLPDTGATWQATLVRGTLPAFATDALIGTLSDVDGGIATAPLVSGLPSNVSWANTGLEFRMVSGAAPKQALHVASKSNFAKMVKGMFEKNNEGNAASYNFQFTSTDGQGAQTLTAVRITVDDSPATRLVATKYTVPQPLSAIALNDVLMEIEDAGDLGIKSVADLDPNAPLSNWGITWTMEGSVTPKAVLRITNLSTFLSNFPRTQILNSGTGIYSDQISVKATDVMGFERTLSMTLQVSQGSGAYFSPNMVRGKLSAYTNGLVIGYVMDPDGGVTTAPTIKSPMSSLWASTGLAFEKTNDSLPKQALKVVDAGKLGLFLEGGQGIRDGNRSKIDVSFSVLVADATGQTSSVTISFTIDNSMSVAVKESKLLNAAYLADLAVNDTLYSFQDDTDRGIASITHNNAESVFTDWGLEAVSLAGTFPRMGLRIKDYNVFKGKFNPVTSLNQSLGMLEGRMSILATDRLGLWTAITLDFYFTADHAAAYRPAFDLGNYSNFVTGFEIGRVTDADRGVSSVSLAGASWTLPDSGMGFLPDPLKPTEYVLKVVDGGQFKRFFVSDFQYVSITNRYELRFYATVTDPTGGSSQVPIQIKIDGKINTQPTWTIMPGFDGTLAPTGIEPKQTILEIENDADGGIVTAVMASGSIVLADWGLTLTVDSGTKRAVLTAFTPQTFRNQLELNTRLKSNGLWVLQLSISVTDGYGNNHVLPIPVKLRVDTAATLTKPTFPYLEALADGALLSSITDVQDGGIVSYRVISAPGYVPTDNAMLFEINAGVLNIRVGTAIKFQTMARDFFTVNETMRAVSYSMVIETTDAYKGVTANTVNLVIGFAKASLQVTMEPAVLLNSLKTKSKLGSLSFSMPYQFDRVENVGGPTLAGLGITTYDRGAGKMDLIVGDMKLINQAAYTGAMRLNLAGSSFSIDLNLEVRYGNAATEQVPCTLVLGAILMASDLYYLDVPIVLRVDVDEPKTWLSTTYTVQFDVRKYFASPYGGLPDPPVLAPGSAATLTVSSASRYLFNIAFAKAFFTDPVTRANGPVRLPYRLQFGSPTRRGPIDVMFYFHPKP